MREFAARYVLVFLFFRCPARNTLRNPFRRIRPDRELSVPIREEVGHAFEVFGPEHRVRLERLFRRDSSDRACWVADRPNYDPSRICVY